MAVIPDKCDCGQTQQTQTDNTKAHHSSTGEGYLEPFRPTVDRGIGRPGICLGGNIHAQPSGKSRGDGAAQVGYSHQRLRVYENSQDNEYHYGEAAESHELTAQERHSSGTYGGGNLLHAVIAFALTQDSGYQIANEAQGQDSSQYN